MALVQLIGQRSISDDYMCRLVLTNLKDQVTHEARIFCIFDNIQTLDFIELNDINIELNNLNVSILKRNLNLTGKCIR